jgi:phosphoglycolate phosphatase
VTRSYRGVLFDLDGTLVDSYDAIASSLNHARAAFGQPPYPVTVVRRMVGHGLESLIEEALGAGRIEDGVRLFREHYDRVGVEATRTLPGVAPTLETLGRRGYRMGVASNKPARFGRPILERLGLATHFGAILGPDLVAHPKPHREMVDRLLEMLQVPAAEAVYVGDMGVDAETCRNAGIPCWLIATGSCSREELEAAGGERRIERFEDLLTLLPPLPGAA